MEEKKVIDRFSSRLLPEVEKAIEVAYYTGKREGEKEQFDEQKEKLAEQCSRVIFTRVHSGVELSLWIVVPNDFLKVYPWIFKSFSKETLDLVCLQMGIESFSKDIEDEGNDICIVDDLKRQQKYVVDFFAYSEVEVEVEPGIKPMKKSDFDFVRRELFCHESKEE